MFKPLFRRTQVGKNKYNTLGNVNVILRKTRRGKQLEEIQEHLFISDLYALE